MAYYDEDENPSELIKLADDHYDTEKYAEQLARNHEAQGNQLEAEFDATSYPAAPQVPAAEKQIGNVPDKYASLMDEYSKLQNERATKFRNLAIIDGVSQIGQAFAAKDAPNYKIKSNMELFGQMANQPVQDYEHRTKQKGVEIQLKDEVGTRDPNSLASKQARQMAAQRGYPVQPAMSAKEIMDMMKMGDPLKEAGQRQELDIGKQKLSTGEISLKDAEQMRDPVSPISEFYRSMAVKRGFKPEEIEGKSAFDIQAMGKILGKPASTSKQFQTKNITDNNGNVIKTVVFDTSTGQIVNDVGTAGFAQRAIENKRTGEMENYNPALGTTTGKLTSPTPQSEQQAQQEVPEITKEQLPLNKQKQLDEYRKEFLADTKEDRTALQASRSIKGLLSSGKSLDGDILRAVQNKFARATGERGAMTEQDVAPYGGKQAVLDRIGRSMSMWTTGKIPDQDRKFLSGLADLMQKQTERDLAQRTEFFSNNLFNDLKADPEVKAKNFSSESVKKLLGSDIYNSPTVKVRDVKSGKVGSMPAANVDAAIKSGKYELVK